MEIISPSSKGLLLGMPCTTCALGLIQSVFGKSYNPKKPGIAPWSLMKVSAKASKVNVLTPGLTSLANMPNVLETIRALSLMSSISSAVFILIIPPVLKMVIEDFFLS